MYIFPSTYLHHGDLCLGDLTANVQGGFVQVTEAEWMNRFSTSSLFSCFFGLGDITTLSHHPG